MKAIWDRAEEHATRKGGDFSLAWQQIPGVSEKHLFGFYERHATRVSFPTGDTQTTLLENSIVWYRGQTDTHE